MKLENTIRVERAKRRLTQVQLAEKLGMTGQAIHEIEVGKSDPRATTAMKIAKLFGYEVEEIFTLK